LFVSSDDKMVPPFFEGRWSKCAWDTKLIPVASVFFGSK
jgi:hypothetical protein